MEILLAATAMGIAIIVLLLLAGRFRPEAGSGARRSARKGSKPSLAKTGPSGATRSCPLCGAALAPGERIHSDITPGKGDRIMRIFGCPHCWPAEEGKRDRLCPVCGGLIDPRGYAIARYFEKPGRKHVHVLGCTNCRIG